MLCVNHVIFEWQILWASTALFKEWHIECFERLMVYIFQMHTNSVTRNI